MAKHNTPLFSLEAHGTVGDALTYQGKGERKISRTKPLLPYFLTLPVQYQRWLYQDYAYLWRQQSAATKFTYRQAGAPHHLTGYQYWMKDMLTRLPDIMGMWHLDEISGAVAHDSSKNASTMTIFGASPADGPIAGCLSFDGINDLCSTPDVTTLKPPLITVELLARVDLPHPGGYPRLVSCLRNIGGWHGYEILQDNTTSRIIVQGNFGGAFTALTIGTSPGPTSHYAFTYDGTTLRTYFNGAPGLLAVRPGAILYVPSDIYLGHTIHIGDYFLGLEDMVIIYNRALDSTEILRHSLRRWPPE